MNCTAKPVNFVSTIFIPSTFSHFYFQSVCKQTWPRIHFTFRLWKNVLFVPQRLCNKIWNHMQSAQNASRKSLEPENFVVLGNREWNRSTVVKKRKQLREKVRTGNEFAGPQKHTKLKLGDTLKFTQLFQERRKANFNRNCSRIFPR